MGKKGSVIGRAYRGLMGTSKKGVDDPGVGKAIDILGGRGKSVDAAVNEALGGSGPRKDLDDTGAKWDES